MQFNILIYQSYHHGAIGNDTALNQKKSLNTDRFLPTICYWYFLFREDYISIINVCHTLFRMKIKNKSEKFFLQLWRTKMENKKVKIGSFLAPLNYQPGFRLPIGLHGWKTFFSLAFSIFWYSSTISFRKE